MARTDLVAAAAVALALGGGLAASLARQNELEGRLARLEERPDAPADAGARGAGAEAALAARVEEAERRIEVAVTEGKAGIERAWADLARAPRPAAPPQADRYVERAALASEVRAVIDRYVSEDGFREAVKRAQGPVVAKKPRFEELSRALSLSADQASSLEADVREIQMELFSCLKAPRSDGVVPLDEIAKAEQFPEGDPRRGEVFLKLFKLTIPGTEETYVERAVALVKRAKERARTYLQPAQADALDGLDLDWFGIKLDP